MDTNNSERVEFLKKRITTLEWDMTLIKDETLLKNRQAQLNLLRSELLAFSSEKK